MEELQLMVQALAGTIEANMEELRKMERAGKKDTKMYSHKLGEISAYEDTLNMVMWRINQLNNGGK